MAREGSGVVGGAFAGGEIGGIADDQSGRVRGSPAEGIGMDGVHTIGPGGCGEVAAADIRGCGVKLDAADGDVGGGALCNDESHHSGAGAEVGNGVTGPEMAERRSRTEEDGIGADAHSGCGVDDVEALEAEDVGGTGGHDADNSAWQQAEGVEVSPEAVGGFGPDRDERQAEHVVNHTQGMEDALDSGRVAVDKEEGIEVGEGAVER